MHNNDSEQALFHPQFIEDLMMIHTKVFDVNVVNKMIGLIDLPKIKPADSILKFLQNDSYDRKTDFQETLGLCPKIAIS